MVFETVSDGRRWWNNNWDHDRELMVTAKYAPVGDNGEAHRWVRRNFPTARITAFVPHSNGTSTISFAIPINDFTTKPTEANHELDRTDESLALG